MLLIQPALEIINKNITKFNYDIFTKQLELFNNINSKLLLIKLTKNAS